MFATVLLLIHPEQIRTYEIHTVLHTLQDIYTKL